jgi:hypothetical protein
MMKAISFLIILSLLSSDPCYAQQEQTIAEDSNSIHYQARFVKTEIPEVNQLVDFYQTMAKKSLFQRDKWVIGVNNQITVKEGDMPKIVTRRYAQKYTVYRNGDSIDSRSERIGFISKNSNRKETRTYQYLLLDGRVYDYQRRDDAKDMPKIVVASKDLTRRVINSAGSDALALAGYMQGDQKPLAKILAEESSVLHMLPSTQMINGFPTYVLEATTPYGHYTVWMDPNCGYSPRRVIVERGPKDLYDGKPVSTPPPPPPPGYTRKPQPTREHVRFTMEISKIKEIDGGFMATEGSTTLNTDFSSGSKEEIHGVCEFTLIDLNPDFNKIPDAFVLGVPDVTQVIDLDFPEGKFKWKNGKMVPLVAQPIPLLDKLLPELKDIKIDLSAVGTNNKMILVCFFDMNQRPSRNCMSQLGVKTQELKTKGVLVVAVHASKVDDNKLRLWAQKYDINFPVGMIKADAAKTRITWGVRSLPWLILTDKKHIVRAEGFGIEVLDEELKKTEVTPAEQAAPTNNFDPPKSFLNSKEILADWESTYASIRTMSVSYCTTLVDYQPPAKKPDIDMTDLVKYQHVQRVEDGKRYHMRFSKAEDGFDRPESLTEYAFNGKTTQEYFGSSKHGSIFAGLEGSFAETVNDLKAYMLLTTRHTTLADIRAEYPNGAPELSITFKKGMTRGIISVRPNLESVAGELCHVVEIVLPGKDHKGIPRQIKQLFWMAHDKGMCLMKYQEYWDDRLDMEIEVKQITMTDTAGTVIWYPVKACRTKFDEELGTTKYELTVTDFVPNIEVDEDTFRLDFIEGTSITDSNLGKSYTWHKGMKFVLDEWNNNICYVPKDWSILVGISKPLPTFEGIKLKLSPDQTNNRPILICFFDMNQRPSRNCLLQLSTRAKELMAKDVVVVAVQASKIDDGVLNEWVKKNNIPFPVGMVQVDEEKTRFSWGVRSLPWLILTDKKHVVTDEGFSLAELDDKLNGDSQ